MKKQEKTSIIYKMTAGFCAAALLSATGFGSVSMIPAFAANEESKVYIRGKAVESQSVWNSETIQKALEEASNDAGPNDSEHTADITQTANPESAIGWVKSGDAWIYYNADGTVLTDTITPDGYYVDVEGKWRQRTMSLLEESFSLPDRFRTSSGYGAMTTNLEPLERLNKKIRTLIGSGHVFYVYEDSIRYCKEKNSSNSTFLMGLYKDPADDGWQFKISTRLNKSTGRSTEETCDYAVFRFLLGKVSHVPERVSEAIYDSWQGSNSYGITTGQAVVVGDTAITYSIENGAGIYHLSKANAE